MEQVLYVSVGREGLSDADVDDILASSRRNNPMRGLTGLLVFLRHASLEDPEAAGDGLFFQVLEGSQERLDHLLNVIRADPRHHHVAVLYRKEIEERTFPDWAMAYDAASSSDGPYADVRAALEACRDTDAGQQLWDLVSTFHFLGGDDRSI